MELLYTTKHRLSTNLVKSYDIIKKCKEILEKNGARYSDEEVAKIRDILYMLAQFDYELFNQIMEETSRSNDKSKVAKKTKV